MLRKVFYSLIALCLIVSLAYAIAAPAPAVQANEGRGFSIVRLETDALTAIKAQGKIPVYPVPKAANQGRKFNPTGGLVAPVVTNQTQNVLVLFVQFEDTPPGAPAARMLPSEFDNLLFGDTYDRLEYADFPGHPTNRTLKNYYKEVSYGKVTVTTQNPPSSMGWITVNGKYSDYVKADGIHDNGFGPYPMNVQGIVEQAVTQAAASGVDFSPYAINGELPNLFVVYAGTGAEWSGAADILWSHSWDLTEGTGHNGITVNGVKINNYAMMPELGGDLTGFTGVVSGPYPPTVGVFAHEYGHVLGLPDQYDYGYESEGTGMYSLMAGGSWNRYPNYRIFAGNSPAHLDAWSKIYLGFVTPTVINSTKNVTLPPAETNQAIYKMVVPNSGGKEYFLFENRQQSGFDEGLKRWDAHGLAIYHVDDTVFSRTFWRPNEAENWKEFRSEGWQKAPNGETHYGISLIQADDRWHLERGLNAADSGDLYPGSLGKTEFSSLTKPNSSNYYFWAGSEPKYGYSGVTVKNIVETDENISANFSFVPFKAK